MADIDQSVFRRFENGRFEFQYPTLEADYEFAYICEGNIVDRRVTKIISGKLGQNNAVSANRSF